MNKIAVIGVGPGARDGLTLRARAEIDAAQSVFAAKRHAALAAAGQFRPLEPLGQALMDIERAWRAGERVAVIVSGDTGMYSLLPTLTRRLGAANVYAVSGVSALQEFSARLGETWQDACILSAHGRRLPPAALTHAVRTNVSTILFCDAEHSPRWICRALEQGGIRDAEIAVGERLSYPDERISRGSMAEIADGEYDGLCMVRICNPHARPDALRMGIPDGEFVRGNVPMTKREVRALVVSALGLRPDAVVWDVGAGTGSVSVECARLCPWGTVYAIERSEEALSLIAANARKFGVQNIIPVSGAAPAALAGLPAPTHVFLGGCGGKAGEIIRLIESLGVPLRLAANAVTIESAGALLDALDSGQNLDAVQAAINRIEKVGRYHMLKAQNPIFVISADWKGVE